MRKIITSKKFASNVILSICTQIISLAVSFILNLIVPKFIAEDQYAYWQIYVLYVGYVGVLHFGLLDGIVLRYSQYDYDELDKPRIRSQFRLLLTLTAFITLISTVISLFACKNEVAKIICILVAFAVVTKNLVTYSSYTFQITNRINKYAFLIIAQKLVYGVIVVGLLIFRVNDFYWYCVADILGDVAAVVLSFFMNRGMYFGKSIRLKEGLKEAGINISSGIVLMLANWSAALIVGGAKMIVQWRWGALRFGKVSFAFSLASAFLSFVTAVSVVLFPSLKRLDMDRLPELYKSMRNILSPVLLAAMLLYFPGCWILEKWLPNYKESLPYFGILLPMIVYSSKVTLLTNTYLKTYRKERAMLVINMFCVAVGIIAFVIIAYIAGSLESLLIGIVAVIMLNSILSEIIVLRTIRVRIVFDFFMEIAMSVGFMLITQYMSRWWGCLTYAAMLAVYCIINYKKIAALILKLLRKDKKAAAIEPAQGGEGTE